tara:strand:+ start:390 stop:1196 length:807 start_codon:yes stop_codon:yes gene_type:complete
MKVNTSSNSFYYFLFLLGALAFISLIVVISIYFYYFEILVADQALFAQFGDFIGGVLNPIFSFLTVLLLVGSLILQRRELNSVVEELILTRDVHQSSVNMKHYEYLVHEFDKESSDFNMAAQSFSDNLNKRITVDISEENNYKSQEYTLYEVFSDNELFKLVKEQGFLVNRKNTSGEDENQNRGFDDCTELLRVSLETMISDIEKIKALGCPKWRAKNIIDVGCNLIEDLNFSKLRKHAKNSTAKNLAIAVPIFADFKSVFLNYPDKL